MVSVPSTDGRLSIRNEAESLFVSGRDAIHRTFCCAVAAKFVSSSELWNLSGSRPGSRALFSCAAPLLSHSVKIRRTPCESRCQCIQMVRALFTISITPNTQHWPQQLMRMAKLARRFAINSIMQVASRPEKYPDPMAAFDSRVATSMTTLVTSWKKLKAHQTERRWPRSSTATTQRASRLVTPFSMRPAS